MKLISHKSIFTLIITGLIIFNPFSALATDVGGIINSNTTWTLTNSPYIITSAVQIAEGVTLTIEPSVEINWIEGSGTSNQIEVWGSLYAVGTNSSRIIFNHCQILFKPSTVSMDIEYTTLNWTSIYGQNLTLKYSTINGGIYLRGFDCYIEQNIFYGRIILQSYNGHNYIT